MGKFIAHAISWIVVIAIGIPIALWNGYVLTILWRWFLIPASVPDITLKTAVGINLIAAFLVTAPWAASTDDNTDAPAVLKAAVRLVLAAGFGLGALFSGWLYTLFL